MESQPSTLDSNKEIKFKFTVPELLKEDTPLNNFFTKYITPRNEYTFTYQFTHPSQEKMPILNRENNYAYLDKLITDRRKNFKPSKEFNPLFGVASVPGGGKTTFGKHYQMSRHSTIFADSTTRR